MRLEVLVLGSGVAITSLEPLGGLESLRRLVVSGTRRVDDYSPIGRLEGLRELMVVDELNGPRLHARSADFVARLMALSSLRWTPIVDSRDYTPFLSLTQVGELWITPARGMSPRIEALESALPALARERRAAAETIRSLLGG